MIRRSTHIVYGLCIHFNSLSTISVVRWLLTHRTLIVMFQMSDLFAFYALRPTPSWWPWILTVFLCIWPFVLSTRILYEGVPGFVTYCPCDVSYRGLTTFLLHASAIFGNVLTIGLFSVNLTWRIFFSILFCLYIYMCRYSLISWYRSFSLSYFHKPYFQVSYSIVVVLTFTDASICKQFCPKRLSAFSTYSTSCRKIAIICF